ncbi:MAG: hypothetical protein ACK4WB_00655 [Desulfatiglandales bacterium]
MYNEETIVRLQFVGKILSLFTHQLNNHLAIIKDSLGFLRDIAELKGIGKEDAQEIMETINSLDEEIVKATFLSKKLNSFGHRMDSELSTFNLNDVTDEILTLLSRATIEKRLGFVREYGELGPLNGNPSLFQFVLFCLIDRYIKSLPPRGRLRVKTFEWENSVRLLLEPMDELLGEVNPFCPDHIIHLGAEKLSCTIWSDKSTGRTEIQVLS